MMMLMKMMMQLGKNCVNGGNEPGSIRKIENETVCGGMMIALSNSPKLGTSKTT